MVSSIQCCCIKNHVLRPHWYRNAGRAARAFVPLCLYITTIYVLRARAIELGPKMQREREREHNHHQAPLLFFSPGNVHQLHPHRLRTCFTHCACAYIYIYATKWYSWAALALIYNSLNEQQYAWNLPNICIRIFIMLKLFCHRYERPFTCAAPYSQTEHSNECYDRFDLITPKILAWGKATINIQICNIFVKMYMWQNRTGTI